MNLKSSNPAFATGAFQNYGYAAPAAGTMTVQGAISKTFLLLAILSATALWSWTRMGDQSLTIGLIIGASIGGLVVALITCFRPTVAPWTAPVYAALQGVFLGAISRAMEMTTYKGIAVQAVGLTCGALFIMLTLYATRTIRVTDKLRAGILTAMGAVMLCYLLSWVMGMFGVSVPFIHQGGKIGIIFSLFVVGLASFRLLLDFDMIEKGASYNAPKYMEWFSAFGLIMTLVWLYIEVLNLLRQIYSERR